MVVQKQKMLREGLKGSHLDAFIDGPVHGFVELQDCGILPYLFHKEHIFLQALAFLQELTVGLRGDL